MKKLKIKDFLEYDFLSTLNVKNNRIAFLSTNANLNDNKYNSNIYEYDLNSNKSYKITDYNNTNSYIMNDDGDIIFKKDSLKDEDVFYIKKNNKEVANEYFKIKKDVIDIKFFKEDKFLIIASDKKTQKEKDKEKENSFYKEIENLPFWFNGEGFLDNRKTSLYIFDLKENSLKKLISFKENEGISSFDFCKKCEKIVYSKYSFNKNIINLKDEIYIYDLKKNENKLILPDDFSIFNVFLMKQKVYFFGSENKLYGINENVKFYSIDLNENMKLELVSKNDFDMDLANSTGTDSRFGSTRTFKKYKGEIYFLATENDHCKLFKINTDSSVKCIIDNFNVEDFDIFDDKIYFLAMGDDFLRSLFVLENGEVKILYKKEIEKKLGKLEKFNFISNGDTLNGYVLKPVDFDENKKYPALLSVHGGPKTAFSDIFHHEHQALSNRGYFVIYTNPHGSSSRGDGFSDIRGKYGTIDYEDLMNFVDETIKRYPQIDENRLGVFGGSYGGFMTNWIISHTDRFKVANSQRSISNWTSFYGVSDIGFYFTQDQTDANPWDNLEKLWNQSPLKYADKVKTPTLFIHSDNDFRCPLDQGIQMYAKIKLNGVDSKIVIFKDENHELSRSGKPKARVKRMKEIFNWFDKYLK
ncbi:MAG: S9 family peptidase [Peptoniphilaceae bacterium]|nr:S9 family peptidase [Peptoniphilaceae bacterium]MDD7383940.1 S9 family peptidase [Peptoniphilaceae bacterium]MDY3738083.1 S9 family peptidase [Peptoniphilaceae bacterium]